MKMKKLRQRYNREFKISVVTELEGGKSSAQIAREQGIHPSPPSRWRDEYNMHRTLKKHLAVMESPANMRRGLLNWRGCLGNSMPRMNF
jgi:transposase-like protein